MKLVTSMSFAGEVMLKTPFLAETETGTVKFVQCLAEAMLANAATTAVYFILKK